MFKDFVIFFYILSCCTLIVIVFQKICPHLLRLQKTDSPQAGTDQVIQAEGPRHGLPPPVLQMPGTHVVRAGHAAPFYLSLRQATTSQDFCDTQQCYTLYALSIKMCFATTPHATHFWPEDIVTWSRKLSCGPSSALSSRTKFALNIVCTCYFVINNLCHFIKNSD